MNRDREAEWRGWCCANWSKIERFTQPPKDGDYDGHVQAAMRTVWECVYDELEAIAKANNPARDVKI